MVVGPDFRPDEAQDAIVRLAGDVLDGNADTPERGWKALGQAGLLSLAVPTWLGGSGFGALETSLVLTEVGRRALTLPALATLALGVLPVARWGGREQQRDLLAGVGAGTVLTAAVVEPADPLPAVPRTTAGDDWRVTGVKTSVPYAAQAYRILVPVRLMGGGVAVAVVDPTAAGVALRRTPGSGATPEYAMSLDGVPAQPLGTDTEGRSVADLYRFAVAGACAVGDGALAGALHLTSDHVRTRQQFGRPLATFQAVAQQIADVYVAARTLHLAVLAACWQIGNGRCADDDLWVAAHWLTSEAPPALRSCHHLHGGLGLAADYPLHRHSSLIRDLVRFLGGADHCLRRLAASLRDAEATATRADDPGGGRVVHRPE